MANGIWRTFLRSSAAIAWLGVVPHAYADELKDEARNRFDEGVVLYDKGQYEAARAKFLQAYALKKHPTVLLNLASTSLKAGHAKDAEGYYAQYLKETSDDGSAKREEARKGLVEARKAQGLSDSEPESKSEQAEKDSPLGNSLGEAKGEGSSEMTSHGAHPVILGAMLGFGTLNLNFGIGLRGGTYVAKRVYVGGSFVYHVGQTISTTVAGVTANASYSAFYIGPEGGYDFDITPQFVIRPYGGIGFASFSTSASGGANIGGNNTQAAFWPSCAAFYAIPNSNFTVGGDTRFLFIPGGPAFELFASGGAVF